MKFSTALAPQGPVRSSLISQSQFFARVHARALARAREESGLRYNDAFPTGPVDRIPLNNRTAPVGEHYDPD